MNWKILAGGALLVVPLVVVLASGFGKDPHALPNVMQGRPAPDFALKSLDGEPVTLADLKGHPAVVNFWSSWCVPCVGEHPELLRAAQVYAEYGVVFLGVVYNDTPENAVSFLKKRGSAYRHLLDTEGHMSIDYGVAGVPETYVISPEGQIVRKFVGPVSFPVLAEVLEPLAR